MLVNLIFKLLVGIMLLLMWVKNNNDRSGCGAEVILRRSLPFKIMKERTSFFEIFSKKYEESIITGRNEMS